MWHQPADICGNQVCEFVSLVADNMETPGTRRRGVPEKMCMFVYF